MAAEGRSVSPLCADGWLAPGLGHTEAFLERTAMRHTHPWAGAPAPHVTLGIRFSAPCDSRQTLASQLCGVHAEFKRCEQRLGGILAPRKTRMSVPKDF